jgi:hypothetical protein
VRLAPGLPEAVAPDAAMQVPVQVVFHGLAHSDSLYELIRSLAARICRPHARVTRCQVAVELPRREDQEGGIFRVRVTIGVPGSELVCQSEEPGAQAAARSAFAAMRLQLDDYMRRARALAADAARPGR